MPKNEIILDKKNKFVTRYGTTQPVSNPSVIYLRTKSKITPFIKKDAYDDCITEVKEKFEHFVRCTILDNKTVCDNCIFNIDISAKSVRYGKVSFLRYDLYLLPSKRKTMSENKYRIMQLSKKLDTKLEELLNRNGIECR